MKLPVLIQYKGKLEQSGIFLNYVWGPDSV